MKHYLSILRKLIKGGLVLVLFGTICFSILAMKAEKLAADVWTQLGIPVPQAHMDIKNSFLQGYLDYTGAKNAKNIV